MTSLPVALTVAGSDSGGGAGVQADLRAMAARDVFGTSAVTAVTAQNTQGVEAVEPVPAESVAAQIDAVTADFDVRAAKTGMLGDAALVRTVADRARDFDFPLVVDPVMVAESGDRLLPEEAEAALRDDLAPEATVVTPNVPEAEVLSGVDVEDEASMREAARAIVADGPDAALVTGGHLEGSEVVDVLAADEERAFRRERVPDPNSHGSGCTLSAAVAAELAKGADLPAAVAAAEDLLDAAVRFGLDVGGGTGPVHHLASLRRRGAVPEVAEAVADAVRAFERADVSQLVPEVGTTVAAAPPYATDPGDVVAVDGRLTRTVDGVRAPAGVRQGASSHVARFLLGLRDADPGVAAACNLRLDDEVADAAREFLDLETVDRANEPDDARTMDWAAERATEGRERAPDAVLDWGAVGKEPMLRVAADSVAKLREIVLELDERVG